MIGLEIHVQLKTRTKMFCRCANGFGGGPNTQTCPVCLAFPGALPVPNRAAIEETIKLGLALGCDDRRRGPSSTGRTTSIPTTRRRTRSPSTTSRSARAASLSVPTPDGEIEVGIVRAHLEEDAAKNVHVAASGRIHGATATLVDFNRGGTPLLEIVTEPELHSADDAKRFLQLLRQTVVELGLSDAELEKGSMRFDVNVSVRPAGSDELRTRTELKNMNSFNFAAKGIEKEIARQIKIYESGGTVEQETLHFDPSNEDSPPLRSKEEAQDYRYFPEPDLVPIDPPAELVERLRGAGRRAAERADQADRRDALVLRRRRARHRRARPALVGGRRRRRRPEGDGERARERVRRDRGRPGRVNAGRAREARLGARRDPARGVRRGARALRATPGSRADPYLAQKAVSDVSELDPIIDAVIAANPGQAEQYRGGKEGLLGFFVGQVMKETGGKADPRVVSERVREKLRPVAWTAMEKRYLFTPGPTPVPPEVLAAEAEPMVHHRGADFRVIYERTLARLAEVYRTKPPVLLFSASGHGRDGLGGHEPDARRATGSRSSSRARSASAGRRSAPHYGLDVQRIDYEWGEVPDPAEIGAAVAESGVETVFCTQSETSTGVVADVQAIKAAVGDATLVVDAVSSLGAVPLETDAWGIDVVVSGSQKALMCPPGLAMASVADHLWDELPPSRTFYFDWRATRKAQEAFDSAFTPAVSLIRGLDVALGMILDDGLDAAFERHVRLGRAARAGVKAMGLELFSPDDDTSAVVTAVRTPEGIEAPALLRHLRERHGVTLAPGQGALKPNVFRIGHIGWFDIFDIAAALAAIELALTELGADIERGVAVGRAFEAYEQRVAA